MIYIYSKLMSYRRSCFHYIVGIRINNRIVAIPAFYCITSELAPIPDIIAFFHYIAETRLNDDCSVMLGSYSIQIGTFCQFPV